MVDITINSFFIKNEGCVIVVDEITKRVSLVELFYDLVFVYMVSRATEMGSCREQMLSFRSSIWQFSCICQIHFQQHLIGI